MKPWWTTSWTARVPRRDIAGDLSSRAAATTLALSHHNMQPTNKLPAWYLRSKQRAPIPSPGSAGSLPSSCTRPALLCLSFVQICRVRRPSTVICAGRCAERVVKARCPHFSSWFCTFFLSQPPHHSYPTWKPSNLLATHYILDLISTTFYSPITVESEYQFSWTWTTWYSALSPTGSASQPKILAASKTNIGLFSLPIWIHCIVLTRLAQFQGLRITSFALALRHCMPQHQVVPIDFSLFIVFFVCFVHCYFFFWYALLSLRVFLYGPVPSNYVLLCAYSPRMPSDNDQSMPLPSRWIP